MSVRLDDTKAGIDVMKCQTPHIEVLPRYENLHELHYDSELQEIMILVPSMKTGQQAGKTLMPPSWLVFKTDKKQHVFFTPNCLKEISIVPSKSHYSFGKNCTASFKRTKAGFR